MKIDPDISHFIIDLLDNDVYKKHPLCKIIYDKVHDMGLTVNFLKSYDNWYGVDGKKAKLTEIFLEYINHIIENITIFFDNVEWLKVLTD